jgi:hypothetical protein
MDKWVVVLVVVLEFRCWANVRRLGPTVDNGMKELAIERRQERIVKRLFMDVIDWYKSMADD